MTERLSQERPLHLQPLSAESQRVWRIGDCQAPRNDAGGGEVWLSVRPDKHDSFASLKSILAQLGPLAQAGHGQEINKLQGYIREVCPDARRETSETHGKLLTDSVAFAIMRRISRESFYTARVIDLGARLLNAILSQIPGCERVYVKDVDRIDRPSLKVLARAMLLLEPRHRFAWIWYSKSDPTSEAQDAGDNLFVASRLAFLRQLVGILSPSLAWSAGAAPLRPPPETDNDFSPYRISAALILQNYDACFLWGDGLLRSRDDAEVAEALRLLSIAAVNIGRYRDALGWLSTAEDISRLNGRRAHLCYLQGLIEAKRQYDTVKSNACYQRGLSFLEGSDPGQSREDLPLERGWLLNGLALNEAILWRRNPDLSQRYNRAFELENEAFRLVTEGEDAARIYLRFNLVANSALLMEMGGNYDLAIDVFKKAFDFGLQETEAKNSRWQSTLGYRIGVLHYRAGRLEEARQCLHEAAEQDLLTENWGTRERILRALGIVAVESGRLKEAAETFSKGLEICRQARSAEGTREHTLGLMNALALDGQDLQADEVREMIAQEEDPKLVEARGLAAGGWPAQLRPTPPSPKLPAYFPEIDLEGIPAIDLNRFLGRALSDFQTRPWASS